jgi:hypothetical protein
MPNETSAEQKSRAALAENPFPEVPWIRVRDDGIAIVTGYSEALQRLLRWVPNAQWRQRERCWLIPFSGADAVRAVLPEITRLAEAARELDDEVSPKIVAKAEARRDLLTLVVEAAELLHGPDWRAARGKNGVTDRMIDRIAEWEGRSVPDAADPLIVDLAAKLRAKAAASIRVAEALEPTPAGSKSDRES